MTLLRRPSSVGSTGVQLGLIITPMLDMSFQILAFFIMTYHPSALEAHIPGHLAPPSGRNADQPILPLDDSPLLEDTLTVKVKAIARGQEIGGRVEGSPSQIFLKLPLEIEPHLVADVDVDFSVGLKRLETRLRESLKQGAAPAHLKIEADGELRQQYVVAVHDAARRAGFEKVHFVPPPVLNAKIK